MKTIFEKTSGVEGVSFGECKLGIFAKRTIEKRTDWASST